MPDHLNGLEILGASSSTSSILALPESRASCETDNANKVSVLLNTPEWLFITFTKDGCLAYNSGFKYNSIGANILKSSTYLLSKLTTIENAEKKQFPFSSDLKQNKIVLN